MSSNPATGPNHTGRGDSRTRWVLLGLVLVYIVVLLRTAWLADDAFITLRVVDNFVGGHGLRWNVAERVQVFTHPLWMFLLSVPYSLTREPYFTTLAVGALCSIGAVVGLVRAFGRDAVFGISALLLSRAFVDFSTSGLENPLTHVLLVVFSGLVLRGASPTAVGVVAGLLVTNRMDSGLLVLPALLWLVRAAPRWGLRMAPGFLPFVLWEGFSVVYYGSLVPNTALAKLGAGLSASDLVPLGLNYLVEGIVNDPVTGLVLLASLAVVRRGGTAASLVAGAWLYVAYVVWVGGDFMQGRFLSAPLVLAVVGLMASGLLQRALVPATAGVWAVGLLTPLSTLRSGSACVYDFDVDGLSGVADERRYYFPATGLFNGQSDLRRPWPGSGLRLIGSEAGRQGVPVLMAQAVGMKGFYAGPSVHVLDSAALGDPLLARLPLADGHWRIGHFSRGIPAGYPRSLATGEVSVEDERVAELLRHTWLLTRAPLWSGERWAAIATEVVGGTPSVGADYAGAGWDELVDAMPDFGEARVRRARALRQAAPDAAMADLQAALTLDPDDVFALELVADQLVVRGDLAAAEGAAVRTTQLHPEVARLWFRLGELRSLQDRPVEAAEAFLAGADADFAFRAKGLALAASALSDAGRAEEAAALEAEALALDADPLVAPTERGP